MDTQRLPPVKGHFSSAAIKDELVVFSVIKLKYFPINTTEALFPSAYVCPHFEGSHQKMLTSHDPPVSTFCFLHFASSELFITAELNEAFTAIF